MGYPNHYCGAGGWSQLRGDLRGNRGEVVELRLRLLPNGRVSIVSGVAPVAPYATGGRIVRRA